MIGWYKMLVHKQMKTIDSVYCTTLITTTAAAAAAAKLYSAKKNRYK